MTDSTMRALVATGYGEPERLTIADLPIPRPGPGQIQVRVAAATINPTDTRAISGAFGEALQLEFPYIPGTEFAGNVTATGAGVTGYEVGDEVFGTALPRPFAPILADVPRPSLSTGALAEYVVVEADTPLVAHRPAGVPAEQAASLAIAGSTVQAMLDLAAIKPGESVLVIGATGAVGLTAMPPLAAAGARITATAAREAGATLLRRLGAHEIIEHDPAEYPSGVDVVFNLALFADQLPAAARALRSGGRLVSIIYPPPTAEQVGRDDVELHFVWDVAGVHGGMRRVAEAAATGELEAVIAGRYPLDDGVRAIADYARAHPLGKIVVVTGPQPEAAAVPEAGAAVVSAPGAAETLAPSAASASAPSTAATSAPSAAAASASGAAAVSAPSAAETSASGATRAAPSGAAMAGGAGSGVAGVSGLRVSRDRGVVTVVIDNPPVNVLSLALMNELTALFAALRDDDTARVVVFESADPEFFIAHVDMTLADEPELVAAALAGAPDGLNPFQAVGEALRTLPQVSIVKLAGLARGGGAEFVAAADLTFAAVGRAGLGQLEVLGGIVPGGGGTQYLLHRTGRNRALEIVLGAGLFDAETAERYGWINRALPADELDAFVDRLARNIADLPEGTVAAVKHALPPADLAAGMLREHEAWAGQFARPVAERLLRAVLAAGAQTREGERHIEDLMRTLDPSPTPTS
ncbi:enoyl-CoA hydratase-related protein [Catenuloplanes sp. NPDC051500]|uniref:enoyl-CoA hydratase-related protein n=1 Tax=Catenuloplanes sp. NPDC051500 TaxID=3363959 RepID=UPI0037AE37F5